MLTMYLPTEEELPTDLARERRGAERMIRLNADAAEPGNGEG